MRFPTGWELYSRRPVLPFPTAGNSVPNRSMTAGTAAGNNQACRHKYSVCPSYVSQAKADGHLSSRPSGLSSVSRYRAVVSSTGRFIRDDKVLL